MVPEALRAGRTIVLREAQQVIRHCGGITPRVTLRAVKVYKTRRFGKFWKSEGLPDDKLWKAAREVADGDFDADLGGGVFKQRVARPGRGKSAGYRTLILHKRGEAYIFSYGFAKSEKANISDAELKALRELAEMYGKFGKSQFDAALEARDLTEVTSNEDDEDDEDAT